MKTVWNELTKIPYGETRSYKQVAEACGKSRGARAAGMIIGRNPIPIVIPCHRVIGSSGKLVGFRSGLEIKKKLLELEKRPQQHRITSDEND
jgi:methylated-DNA-[protein]-cysteine S-methyltransferase